MPESCKFFDFFLFYFENMVFKLWIVIESVIFHKYQKNDNLQLRSIHGWQWRARIWPSNCNYWLCKYLFMSDTRESGLKSMSKSRTKEKLCRLCFWHRFLCQLIRKQRAKCVFKKTLAVTRSSVLKPSILVYFYVYMVSGHYSHFKETDFHCSRCVNIWIIKQWP